MVTEDSAEDFISRTRSFEVWLQTVGVTVSSKIKLADLRHRSAGRAVLATQDISTDEELFTIPRSSILTVQTSDLPTAVQEEIDDPWLSLILAMIYEYQRGSGSRWKPYFDVLPESFDTLMYWSNEELKHLEGSAVVNKIGRKSADKAFTEQIIPIIRRHADFFSEMNRNDAEILQLCHRMGSIIMAYAFDLERTSAPNDSTDQQQDGWEEDSDQDGGDEILPKGMVPLADMLNADADRNNAKLFYEDDKVVMKAIEDVSAGQELFNDYGPLPSADVLRRYGYVTAEYAKYDVVEISVEMIKDVAAQQLKMPEKEIEARTSYLDEAGILDDGYDIVRQGSEESQVPDELSALLNALTMSDEDFAKLKKKEKLPKPELSKPSLELLYAVLVQRRSLYPSSAEEPVVTGVSNGQETQNRRLQMAGQVIEGEKRVLREAAETVQRLLSDNDTKKRKADRFEAEANTLRSSAAKKAKIS